MGLVFQGLWALFFNGVAEKARIFCGVLMVKSWWICGELRSVELLFFRGENLPHFAILFLARKAEVTIMKPEAGMGQDLLGAVSGLIYAQRVAGSGVTITSQIFWWQFMTAERSRCAKEPGGIHEFGMVRRRRAMSLVVSAFARSPPEVSIGSAASTPLLVTRKR